jgi:hypothetical protein
MYIDISGTMIDNRMFGPLEESSSYVWWNLIENPSFAAEIPKPNPHVSELNPHFRRLQLKLSSQTPFKKYQGTFNDSGICSRIPWVSHRVSIMTSP